MNAPTVRIGIIQDKPKVTFRSLGGDALLKSVHGDIQFQIAEGKTIEVQANESPLPGRWLVFASESKNRSETELIVEKLKRKWPNKPVGFVQVGRAIRSPDATKVISDNRAYWVYVEANSELEAQDIASKLESEGWFPRVRLERMWRSRGTLIVKTSDIEVNIVEGIRVIPVRKNGLIEIDGVIVGIGFHWQHEEPQSFRGIMEFVVGKLGGVTVINELTIDEYLFSVNSSEMVNAMHIELLKAQTVIARSTVLATIGRHHYDDPFDLCADDHCQVYRGTSREIEKSIEAVVGTDGEVLTFNGEVCDTRYAKVCGGITESFKSVWGIKDVPYLVPVVDAPADEDVVFPADTEERARKFIDSRPKAFCNLDSADVPFYLRYARKYFRWKVEYSREELEEIIKMKTGIDFGKLKDIVPLSRGASGRIEKLKIVGTQKELLLSPELKIRQALSRSTLYSSAFYPVIERDKDGIPTTITLVGAGWGHGVGLCQLGAAMMAEKGFTYRQILEHYYPGARISKVYNGIGYREPLGRGYRFCFEALNCYDVLECPYYEKFKRGEVGRECWKILGTRCFGEVQDTWEKKKET